MYTIKHALLAETLGSLLLALIVIGSGIMATQLTPDTAVALLANSIATGLGLWVLITLCAPFSGAHFNPAVSLWAACTGQLAYRHVLPYWVAQLVGCCAGVMLAHALFDQSLWQLSSKIRWSQGQMLSEVVSVAMLLGVIYYYSQYAPKHTAMAVATTVTVGYWVTSSTFFANPALTFARAFTDSFAGIYWPNALGFIGLQFATVIVMLGIKRFI